jgi:hypothetical protein
VLAALLSVVLLLADASPTADLTGTVVGKDGKPVAGATVLVNSAAPKQGTSATNPFDYPDCVKSVVADPDGTFKIIGVDSSLNYKLIVCADGFKTVVLKKVDAEKGKITATLREIPKDVEPNQLLKGHVTDASGEPIAGARIEPFGCQESGGNRWWGTVDKICDSETYTDGKGDFVLVTKKPDVQIDLKVFAPHQAGRLFPLVSVGESIHELGLSPGASLTGRLLKDDKPLAGINMRLVQKDRSPEHYLSSWDAVTDDAGAFTFKNLPADDDCLLYAEQKSLGDRGTIPLTPCRLTGDGTTVDAGDMAVEPGRRVAGTLVTSDGTPLPEGSKVYIGPWDGDDTLVLNVGKDGKFEFKCVRGALSQIWIRVTGYHISAENQSFEPANANMLLGLVEEDIDDLRVQLDPGPNEQNNYNANKWQLLQTTRLTGMPPQQ